MPQPPRFHSEPERTPFDDELVQSETESDDPFLPPARRAVRRHEVKPHQVRPHQVRRREIKRRASPRIPVSHAPNELPRRVRAPQTVSRGSRMKRFVKRLLAVAAVLFVGQCVFAALTAPQFEVKRVALSGLDVLPRERVEPLAARLLKQNVFRADVSRVKRAVEAIPVVESARVKRNWTWPPQMSVEITERSPLLRVGGGENWWIVDEAGMPFRRANDSDSKLYALAAPQLLPREGRKLPVKWWTRAIELHAALETDNKRAEGFVDETANARFWELRRLYFDKHGMASIRVSGVGALKNHRELLIRLGEGEWAPKLARAREAIAYFERTQRQAQELDLVSLRFPRWVPHPQLVKGAREREGQTREQS